MTTFEEKLKNDIEWIMSIYTDMPAMDLIEPAAQSLGIMQSLSKTPIFDQKEIIKISISGWLGAKARKVDEKRFQDTSPYAFLHVANHLVDRDDNGENYQLLITKLMKK